MLIPKQRVWRYQISLVIALTTTFTSIFLIIYFQPTKQNIGDTSRIENTEVYGILAESPVPLQLIEIGSTLILFFGLLVLIELLFLWMPSFSDLTESKMVWKRKVMVFPERILYLLDAETRIIIRRKRSSFLGWIMREFTMETYVPKVKTNIKQITDFSGIERIIKTPTHNILVKTVRLEHIPLQVIQIRSLLL